MSTHFPYLSPSAHSLEKVTYAPSQQIKIVTTNTGVTIGTDFERHVPVTVQNKEREGGFYVLGEPRAGKSTLLVSMALQDIENGHGLLFIDPHYDAINQLRLRLTPTPCSMFMYYFPTVSIFDTDP
jgi:hypothetical protein